MKRSVEISFERLKTDRVEMLHLHGPQIEDMTDKVLYFLSDLKSQGLVRAVGVNSFDTDVLEYICEQKNMDFVMLDYNIMRQDREDLILRMHNNGIGVIGGAALAQSLYSNRVFKVRSKVDVWYLLRALKNWRGHIAQGMNFRFINKVQGITGNQVALRYVLDNNNITSSVFGTSNIEHLCENCKASDIVLPDDITQKIKSRFKNNADLDRR